MISGAATLLQRRRLLNRRQLASLTAAPQSPLAAAFGALSAAGAGVDSVLAGGVLGAASPSAFLGLPLSRKSVTYQPDPFSANPTADTWRTSAGF